MAPPSPRHCCECHGALPRTPGLLYPRPKMNSIEGYFENMGEPDPWPSTIYSLWSNPLTLGTKRSDIEEPALEDSAPVLTPPITIPKYTALAEKPHHRDSFACLDSPLKSLPAEVADLGSLSIFSFSFLPQWSRSKWWSAFSRFVSHDI